MAIKQQGAGTRSGATERSGRPQPYFERLDPSEELVYGELSNGDAAFEVRIFDDREQTGQVKVQFHQLGRRRKVSVLSDDEDLALLQELIEDLSAVVEQLRS